MIIIETERLLIKRFSLSDADAMNAVFGDPQVMHFGSGAQTPEWIRDWLSRCAEIYRKNSGVGPWAVVEKSSNRTAGYCGLFDFPDVDGQQETEIGYRLAKSVWGQGYATEAARAVRDYAFGTLGLHRLISLIDPENVASIRVAEKVGMRYEKEVMLEGYTHPDHVYAIARAADGD